MSLGTCVPAIRRAEYLLEQVLKESGSKPQGSERQRLACLLLEIHSAVGAVRPNQDRSALFGVYAYLVLFARYPRISEIARISFMESVSGIQASIENLIESEEFRDFLPISEAYQLVKADPSALHVDVTHTASYGLNSGVQRVVRSLCGELVKQKRQVCFFGMEGKESRPALLSDAALARLANWENPVRTPAPQTGRVAFFVRSLGFQLLKFPLDLLVHLPTWTVNYLLNFSLFGRNLVHKMNTTLGPLSVRWARFLEGEPKKIILESCQVLVFSEPTKFLVAELPTQRYAEFYLTAQKHLSIEISLVVYDLICIFQPEFFEMSLRAEFLDYARLFRVADRLACISRTVAEQLRLFLANVEGAASKVEVQYIGCDPTGAVTPVFALVSDVPMVLCVGTCEPRKNGITLLRAAVLAQRRGAKFRLVFAGSSGWLTDEFHREYELAVRDGIQVECLGHVSEAQLQRLYREARFTVFPSLREGFGLPIVESLHFGRPCIVSNLGPMREIGEKGGCVLINDPLSFEEICGAITKLLDDKLFYERLLAEAQAFRWRTWADYADGLYRFATDSHPAPKAIDNFSDRP